MTWIQCHFRALIVGLCTGAAILAAALVASPVTQATAASTCTTTALWNGSTEGYVKTDTCNTGVRLVGDCTVSEISGNTVYDAGDNFGIGASNYDNWAEACENSNFGDPILYLFFEERGVWQNVANNAAGGSGTYTQTWTAR